MSLVRQPISSMPGMAGTIGDGAGRQHVAAGAYFRIAGDEPSSAGETGLGIDHRHAERGQPLGGDGGRRRRHDLADMRHHRLEIDLRLGLRYAELGAGPHRLRLPCGGDRAPRRAAFRD